MQKYAKQRTSVWFDIFIKNIQKLFFFVNAFELWNRRIISELGLIAESKPVFSCVFTFFEAIKITQIV